MVRMITETAQSKFGPFFFLGVIVVLTACVYFNSFQCPFIWDDQDLVIENTLIKDFRFIPKIFTTDLAYGCGKESKFYRPIQQISYMFDYYIVGLKPFFYHIHNLSLHILNSLLVFFILSVFLAGSIAFLTALLFAIHPIHVEAVTYISGRADLLTGFFMLLSLLLYISYRRKGLRRFYGYSLFAFLLALFSKELALIFPLVVVLLDKSFIRNDVKLHRVKFSPILGFLVVDVLYLCWRFFILGGKSLAAYSTRHAFGERLLFFLKSLIIYIKKLMIPVDLTMSYTVKLPKGIFDPWVLVSLVFVLATLIFLPYFYKKRRAIFFGILWFLIFLLPQSNLFTINAFLADHFVYLSSIGFFLVVSYLLVTFIFKNETDRIS